MRKSIEATGKPVAQLFVDTTSGGDSPVTVATSMFGDLPDRFRGDFVFAALSHSDYSYQLEEFGKYRKGCGKRTDVL